MSAIYDKVVKALQLGAAQQGNRQILVNPADFAELRVELGNDVVKHDGIPDGTLWTPGSWLLQIPILADDTATPGKVVLQTQTWRWL